jgi:uncharacterized membrane protein YphA (DoxX/SURF4 family)
LPFAVDFGVCRSTYLRRKKQVKTKTYVLWTIQVVLALLFLFAGGMKLAVPVEVLTKQMPLPGLFLRFIGVTEVMGAAGLILPGLLRVRQHLTAWAAAGLVTIMTGAVVVSVATMGPGAAVMPMIVGLLAGYVAWARQGRAIVGLRSIVTTAEAA